MDVAGRKQSLDHSLELERIEIDDEYDARIVDDNIPQPVANRHRLGHVAQLDRIRATEHLVLHPHRVDVVVGQRSVPVHEISFVGNEQPSAVRTDLFGSPSPVVHAGRHDPESRKQRQ